MLLILGLEARGSKGKKNLSRWGDEWFIFLFYSLKPQSQVWIFILNFGAQNNFRTVAIHDDQPNKFLLGQVLFLTGQNIGKKSIYPFVIFYQFVNVIVFYKVGCLFVCVTGQHDRWVKLLASQIAIQAGHCPLTGHYFYHWIWICFNVTKCNLGEVKHETMLASGLHR